MRPKSKVDLFAAIRRDSRTEGLPIRALARKYDVHRRTVREPGDIRTPLLHPLHAARRCDQGP
ncbi:hypothetical protein GCM10010304_83670 [Streptomyces roseoviolaceus]